MFVYVDFTRRSLEPQEECGPREFMVAKGLIRLQKGFYRFHRGFRV